MAAFESDEDIQQKISDSNGEPTYIGKSYPIEINGQRLEQWEQNGRKFDSKAVVRSGITYLPAVPIAMAVRTKLEWRAGAATLKTAYGEVVGFEKKKQIYMNADDAIVLFNLDGGLQSKVFKLQTVKAVPLEEEPIDPKKDKKSKDKKTDDKKVDDKKSKDKKSEDKKVDDKKGADIAPIEEKTVDNKTLDDEAVDDKALDDKAVDVPTDDKK